ncbi:MAG TPA: hypothetical protein VFN69_04570 [Rudaea sp.]|nr:hypothetical protein [Rudaea sp.]
MSRARNIKPGFFKNEDLVELPFEYRLLYIGLWTLADREGRLEDRPKRIRMEVFPGDEVNIEAGMSALHSAGFVHRYKVDGVAYVSIPAWKKHQNPHCREAASRIPPPSKASASTVPERCAHSSSPADSLIPDSLIPDSKAAVDTPTQDSARDPEPPPSPSERESAAPTLPISEGARACLAMRQAGAIRVNPSHPILLAGIAEGATPEMYANAVREAIDRGKSEPFAYAIAAVRGQLAEAKQPPQEPTHANRSPSRKRSVVERVEAAIVERREREAAAAAPGTALVAKLAG